jgi:hypothetical protein
MDLLIDEISKRIRKILVLRISFSMEDSRLDSLSLNVFEEKRKIFSKMNQFSFILFLSQSKNEEDYHYFLLNLSCKLYLSYTACIICIYFFINKTSNSKRVNSILIVISASIQATP